MKYEVIILFALCLAQISLQKSIDVEKDCPKFCTLEYAPVCGIDSTGNTQTFGNLCSFKSSQCENRDAGWKILNNGQCQLKTILDPTVDEDCPKFCTLEYVPVCGVDNTGNHKTFGNLCSFKAFHCENRDAGWKILNNGQCQLKTILDYRVVEDCPKFCTLEYAPVCGMDNTGNQKTFSNKCFFMVQQCENRAAGWAVAYNGACKLKRSTKRQEIEDCPKVCTLEYVPVCGVDNTGNQQTFGNMCEFKSQQCENRDAGWKVLNNGECTLKSILEEDCPKICTSEYAPVCGMDNTGNQQTFGNMCSFKSQQCENRDAGWKVLNNGECQLKTLLEEDCPKICTLEYAPVCDMDNTGNQQTFGNLCSFKSQQCENRDAGWKVLNNGECQLKKMLEDNCPKFCTLEYAPVCGTDNTGNKQTFSNKCFFEKYECENRATGWKVLHTGTCEVAYQKDEECPRFCTLEYAPICATDSTGNRQTFSNKCFFKRYQCENRDAGWKMVHAGKCFNIKNLLMKNRESENCMKICTLEYAPVCGVDNTGKEQTFSNKCFFETNQCENRNSGWKVLHMGACGERSVVANIEDCPKICTLEYFPVCGTDNSGNLFTFANKCFFKREQCENRAAGWKVLYNGECQETTVEESAEVKERICNGYCTFEYAPLCGQNQFGELRTFPNKCMYEHEVCANRDQLWKVLKPGECEMVNSNDSCLRICTREYAPVCGTDKNGNKKTFGNKCMFEMEQCEQTYANWKLVKVGEC